MPGKDRYALVDLGQESLLLDLTSGGLFQLNESAALIWGRALAGDPASAVAEALASRYRIPPTTARADVDRALSLDDADVETNPRQSPFLYQRANDGYVLSRDGVALFDISATGATIALNLAAALSARELPMLLQSVAPKLMSLRGHFVLHASAVVLGSGVVAFCGRSGAGKTTTARALARAGASFVAQDKLVVRLLADRLEAYVQGEANIMAWVVTAAAELAAGRPASCADLDAAARGDVLPVLEIGFLDASRRSGQSFATVRLGDAAAAKATFSNAFHGSDSSADWRQQLEIACVAVRGLAGFDVTVPADLPALEAASADLARAGTLLRPR
jgi:hypothetical protein